MTSQGKRAAGLQVGHDRQVLPPYTSAQKEVHTEKLAYWGCCLSSYEGRADADLTSWLEYYISSTGAKL